MTRAPVAVRGATRTGRPMTARWATTARVAEGMFLVVALLVLLLQVELFRGAGAFWRDEVSTILVARQPSWEAMLAALATDSFPALLASLLRVWIASGLGATDAGVRLTASWSRWLCTGALDIGPTHGDACPCSRSRSWRAIPRTSTGALHPGLCPGGDARGRLFGIMFALAEAHAHRQSGRGRGGLARSRTIRRHI